MNESLNGMVIDVFDNGYFGRIDRRQAKGRRWPLVSVAGKTKPRRFTFSAQGARLCGMSFG